MEIWRQGRSIFFRKVVDSHEIWTVWDGDELPIFEGSVASYFCVWPTREYAELFYNRTIFDPKYIPIPIDDFVDDILFRGGRIIDSDIGIFPVEKNQPFPVLTPEVFLENLIAEWRSRLMSGSLENDDCTVENVLEAIKTHMKATSKVGPKGKIP